MPRSRRVLFAYNLPRFVYDGLQYLGEDWTANQTFIRASVNFGQQVQLSTVPALRGGSTYYLELLELERIGLDPNTLPLVPLPYK